MGGDGGKDEVAGDLEAWGAPADLVEAERTRPVEVIGIWAENRTPWLLWVDVQTQWRSGWEGMATGLDYAGVMAVARWMGIEPAPDLFADLRAMETATLRALMARREREKPRK